mmetsp:Transcript_41617/g.77531  ORF Transcript_41617/g.77531 Transcript_41617/m.77531 type:complete len:529 (+) Transcript_41617:105-1691(+)
MKLFFGLHHIWTFGVFGVTFTAIGEGHKSLYSTAEAALLPESALPCTRSTLAMRTSSACQATASTGQMLFQLSQQAQAVLHDQEAYREFLDSEALLSPSSAADPEALLIPSSAADSESSVQPPSFLELEEQMAPDTVGPTPDAGDAPAASPDNSALNATMSFASRAATAAAKEVDEAYMEQVEALHFAAKGLTSSAFIAVVAVFLALAMLCNVGKSDWVLRSSKRDWWWCCCTSRRASPSALPAAEIEVSAIPKLASSCFESFSIPLIRAPEAGGEVSTLQINRSSGGPPLQSRMCCNPEGGSWSKIEIGPEDETPFVVCKLVESAADAESRNVQGALESWLSLLLDEKSNYAAAENTDVTCLSPLDPVAGHAYLPGGCQPILEMCNGIGTPLGVLWPAASESAQSYNLVSPHGQPVVDIEANFHAGWIAMSKTGQVVALAKFKQGLRASHTFGSPITAQGEGATIDSQDLVQVDLVSGSTPEETALLLACTFAVLVLEARAESAVNGDVAEGRHRETSSGQGAVESN